MGDIEERVCAVFRKHENTEILKLTDSQLETVRKFKGRLVL